MSAKSKAAKAQWQARQGSYPQDLTDDIINQITKGAAARMDAWTAGGHIPLWIRAKAIARGRRFVPPATNGWR